MEIENPQVKQEEEHAQGSISLAPFCTLSNNQGPITCIKYSPNGNLLAVASSDKTISVYDTADFSCKYVITGHEKGVNGISWSPDSLYIASCSDDKTIRIWSSDRGSLVRYINKLSFYPTCIAYNPRGTIIACSCTDHHIYFFSVQTRHLVKTIYAHSNTITTLEYNVDGSRLMSSSSDGYCRIWDCESGNCIQSIRSAEKVDPIVCARFSPNNKYILLSTLSSNIYLWCLDDNKIEANFKGYHNISNYLCTACFYSTNMHCVITGDEEGNIAFYDLNSDNASKMKCCNEVILSLDVSPAGNIALGSMGTSNIVLIYKHII